MRVFIFCFFISMPSFATDIPKIWDILLSEDGINVYGAPKTEDGLIPFKAVTTLSFPREMVLKALKDLNRKPEWSPKLKRVKVHKRLDTDHLIFSEYYKTPWPASDREFLLEGRIIHRKNETILTAKSIDQGRFKDFDHIQAEVGFLDVILKDAGPNRTSVAFRFVGHMKGWMPVWLINIIQKKWPLRFLQGLRAHLSKL